jgi:hypothetical protein
MDLNGLVFCTLAHPATGAIETGTFPPAPSLDEKPLRLQMLESRQSLESMKVQKARIGMFNKVRDVHCLTLTTVTHLPI